MKGSVDTSTLMKAVLDETTGLRTGRVLSDVVALEYHGSGAQRLVMITDGGVVTTPDLKTKKELIINAVEVAHALGNPMPNVAVLSATEFVNPSLQSTMDAARAVQDVRARTDHRVVSWTAPWRWTMPSHPRLPQRRN